MMHLLLTGMRYAECTAQASTRPFIVSVKRQYLSFDTTFDRFPVVVRSGYPTPDLWPQTHPCFLARGVGRVGAAPSTHQDQGL
jgi:hypothetical protein